LRAAAATIAIMVPLCAWSVHLPAGVHGQFASGIRLVEVYVTVTDRHGQPVSGLSRSDFHVREDGRLQTITAFAAGAFPLAVAIAIDRSFSMGERVGAARAAARAFVGALERDDRVMVVAIGSETEVAAPLTADHRQALDAIDRIDRWGTTPLYDAAVAAIDAIQPANGRRALVLLSDGADRYSRTSSAELVEHARDSDVLVYPVAMARSRPPIFAELAAATGGRSFHEDTPARLQTTMTAIARELRFQYLLGYAPAQDGREARQWRRIEVGVTRTDVIVRARDGYWSR
jgi:Ca-activated chloride channel family protein